MKLRSAFVLLSAAAAAIFSPAVLADYPERPIRLVVPFAPGGGADLTSRIISQRLGDVFGKQIVVENRAGGASNLGTELVARAVPDGHTLLLASLATSVNASLFPRLSFNVLKDFEPVTLFVTVPLMVVVHPSSPIRSVQDLVAAAKANPGKLNYASGGLGSANHVAGELFKTMANVQITHVPYKGGGPAMSDLIGGHVDLLFGTITLTHDLVKSGRIRALATTGSRRSSTASDLPTVDEAGLPGYVVDAWYGVMAPAGTPRPIVARLGAELGKIAQTAEVRDALRAQGAETVGNSPEEFGRYLRAEVDKWAKTVKAQGLQAE